MLYCDAIPKGNADEAAAMDGLANSTDLRTPLTDAGEDFRRSSKVHQANLSEGTLARTHSDLGGHEC